uniref:Uncharacterized protein n=1 Tax=Meloidogyne enterolobii TaxID=390850 RepID=A0A6V7UB33_MELEN|nr:unnamed protein product [Meloidogyne enterolobii]
MFWPRRGQLPLLSCTILIFSYYFSNGFQMQKEGMVIKDTLDKTKDKLEPSCTSTIVENFNDFNEPINVWGTLQLLGIDANSTCQQCLEHVFDEAFRYNTEKENQYFGY